MANFQGLLVLFIICLVTFGMNAWYHHQAEILYKPLLEKEIHNWVESWTEYLWIANKYLAVISLATFVMTVILASLARYCMTDLKEGLLLRVNIAWWACAMACLPIWLYLMGRTYPYTCSVHHVDTSEVLSYNARGHKGFLAVGSPGLNVTTDEVEHEVLVCPQMSIWYTFRAIAAATGHQSDGRGEVGLLVYFVPLLFGLCNWALDQTHARRDQGRLMMDFVDTYDFFLLIFEDDLIIRSFQTDSTIYTVIVLLFFINAFYLLIELVRTTVCQCGKCKSLDTIELIVSLVFVEMPYAGIRMYCACALDIGVSPLILKNILSVPYDSYTFWNKFKVSPGDGDESDQTEELVRGSAMQTLAMGISDIVEKLKDYPFDAQESLGAKDLVKKLAKKFTKLDTYIKEIAAEEGEENRGEHISVRDLVQEVVNQH